jgi:SPOC domain.
VKFVPANQTQEALFTDYLKYFLEKQRAGVVSLKKHVLYLLPPTEETFKIHPFGNNEILGVFVNIDEVSAKGKMCLI